MSEAIKPKTARLKEIAASSWELLRHSEKRSNWSFVLIGALSGLFGLFAGKGFDTIWSSIFPDQSEAYIETIHTNTSEMEKTIQQMLGEMSELKDAVPEAVLTSLEQQLSEISRNVDAIRPAATALTVPTSGFARGSKISEGPHTGKGAFFLAVDGGNKGDSAELCDGYTATFQLRQFSGPRLTLNGPSKSIGDDFPSGKTQRVEGVNVTFNSGYDDSGLLQVIYDCNATT